jgi:hypothetical protein
LELASSCENFSAVVPWCSSSPPPPPPEKKHPRLYPKTSPLSFHHQCSDPRIDPIGKPPFANAVHRTHAKDSHPRPASDRALTSSRTRISSPLAIEREQRRACSNSLPRRNTTATRARAMGQDYPLTGPSPGANPPIYPSSLPRASGSLFSNISPKSHGFFFSSHRLIHKFCQVSLRTNCSDKTNKQIGNVFVSQFVLISVLLFCVVK